MIAQAERVRRRVYEHGRCEANVHWPGSHLHHSPTAASPHWCLHGPCQQPSREACSGIAIYSRIQGDTNRQEKTMANGRDADMKSQSAVPYVCKVAIEESSSKGLQKETQKQKYRCAMTYIYLVHICPILQEQLGHFGMTLFSSIVDRGAAAFLKFKWRKERGRRAVVRR